MSSVENLNKIFLEFCDDLVLVNSSKKESIESSKKKIVENASTKYYLEYFFRHCLPYSTAITSCNSEQLSDMNLLHGLKFADIYANCPSLSSKHALWRYLHTFYLLVQSYTKVNKIIEKYEAHENITKIKEALANHDDNLKNIMASSAKFAEDILKEQASKHEAEAEAGKGSGAGTLPNMFEGMDEGKFEEKFMNSSIGNLAKEISQDLDLSDLQNLESPDDLMKSFMNGGSGGLGSIIQKVSSKLQTKLASGDLNEEALMKDATQMMGMLNPALQSMGLGGMGGGKGGKGMEGMGNLFSMMGGLMGGGAGGKKKKHTKKK
jgi:hypothetical protein